MMIDDNTCLDSFAVIKHAMLAPPLSAPSVLIRIEKNADSPSGKHCT